MARCKHCDEIARERLSKRSPVAQPVAGASLHDAVRDMMRWGVTLDDSRLKYIEVQVDRAAIAAVEAALKE